MFKKIFLVTLQSFFLFLNAGREVASLKFEFVIHPLGRAQRMQSVCAIFKEHSLRDLNGISHCYDANNSGNSNLIPYKVNVLSFSNNDITDISGLYGMFCTTIHTINLECNQIASLTVLDLNKLKRAFPNLRVVKLNLNPFLLSSARDLIAYSRSQQRPTFFKIEIHNKVIYLNTVQLLYNEDYSNFRDPEDDDDQGAGVVPRLILNAELPAPDNDENDDELDLF